MRFIYLFFVILAAALWGKEGLDYTYVETPNSSSLSFLTTSQAIHIIKVDPALYEIKPVKAVDDGIGRESVLSISTRYQAAASINGGFFSIGGTFDGKANGALKIEEWFALPIKPRGCIGWSADSQRPLMDRLWVKVVGSRSSGPFSIDGLNRPRKPGEIVLFTPCFHRTTLTNPDGQEIVVVDEIVQSIRKGGSSKIPEKGYVLSIQEKHPLFNTFSVGARLSFSFQVIPLIDSDSSKAWESLDYIVGGTPLLVHHQIKLTDFKPEQTIPTFLTGRHARSAVGLLPNGHWIFVVVDKTTLFDGMTMDELATLMHTLGCVEALNLDGGGSSTMVVDNSVKNSPRGDEDEGKGEATVRRVSDAIVILPKTR